MTDLATNLQIRTQRTPNPNAWKFILSVDIKKEGKVSYSETRDCEHVPMATALLRLANVSQVHLFENVITVTQNGASEWAALAQSVQDVIRNKINEHDPDFVESVTKPKKIERSALPAELQHLEEILDRTIRPGLQADGGDVEVLELDGNVLTVRYQGACGSCPSAMMGTLQGIESILRSEFNPYLEVVAV